VPQDLRHTVATKMADLDVQPHIIEEILNRRGGYKTADCWICNRSSYEHDVKPRCLYELITSAHWRRAASVRSFLSGLHLDVSGC
jgi:hypothetical protein